MPERMEKPVRNSGNDPTVILGAGDSGGPPATIAGYKIVRRLGEGGMGFVLLGRDPHLHRPVAIKLIRKELVGNEFFVERFLREARLSAAMSHPNIVTTYQAGLEGGTPFLVLEYVEGMTLRDRLQTPPPLSVQTVIGYFLQCCDGLEAAAAGGIVHRDFKPANVMVRGDGIVKLMDFGLAKQVTGETMTVTTAVMGTPDFMSPEQATGRKVDFRTDIYAMGIALFQCTTGYLPFKETSAFETMKAHIEKPLPEDEGLAKIAGGRLVKLIRRMAEKEPEKRPGSYQEIRRALEEILDRIGSGKPLIVGAARAGESGELAMTRPMPGTPEKERPAPVARKPKAAPRKAKATARKPSRVPLVVFLLVMVGALAGGGYLILVGARTPAEPKGSDIARESKAPDGAAETPKSAGPVTLKVGAPGRPGAPTELLHQLGALGSNQVVDPSLAGNRTPIAAGFANREFADVFGALETGFGWTVVATSGLFEILPGPEEPAPLPAPEASEGLSNIALNTVGQKLTLHLYCEILARDRGLDYLLIGESVVGAELPRLSVSGQTLPGIMAILVERGLAVEWTLVDGVLVVRPMSG